MNPNAIKNYTSAGNSSAADIGGVPLPTHEAPNTDKATDKPIRAGQIGEGSYEGTDGYSKSIESYLRTADVDRDAEAAAPRSAGEARELLAAEAEGASHSKAPGK